MLPKSSYFVFGFPMNSKSATCNVFQAEPLYQANNDGKTASVYQIPKHYVAIATDKFNFAEPRLRHSLAREVIESSCAEKAFQPLPMKRYSASRLSFSFRTSQHFEIALFPLFFFQKPRRRST